jgi:hypothetical protein
VCCCYCCYCLQASGRFQVQGASSMHQLLRLESATHQQYIVSISRITCVYGTSDMHQPAVWWRGSCTRSRCTPSGRRAESAGESHARCRLHLVLWRAVRPRFLVEARQQSGRKRGCDGCASGTGERVAPADKRKRQAQADEAQHAAATSHSNCAPPSPSA